MNRILLTVLTSVALTSITPSQVVAATASSDVPTAHEHQHAHHEKMASEKTGAEMLKECEEGLEKLKNTGASLPADLKTEFDYNLEIAGVEIKAVKSGNLKNHKKHALSCHRHLTSADLLLKKQESHLAREKKIEERKAKMEERKARAEERKAKAEERKAKREAEKAAAHHDKKDHAKNKDNVTDRGVDHGKSEGADKAAPSNEPTKPTA